MVLPIYEQRAIRIAALGGLIGPAWLSTTIVVLSQAEFAFMRQLGWHPLNAPTTDWPSGLALGPYGGWMIAAFLGCGALLPGFAWALSQVVPRARLGTALLAAASIALAALAFQTDPTYLPTPRTWHGALHDAAFVVLGLTLFPAMIVLAQAFLRDPWWRVHGFYTLATVLLAAPAFALKGIAFYLFLAAIIAWFLVTSLRIRRRVGS